MVIWLVTWYEYERILLVKAYDTDKRECGRGC